MKRFLKIFLWGWLVFGGFFGLLTLFDTPKQIKKDRQFTEFYIARPVQSIKKYLREHGTLPSQSNYDALIITDTKHIPEELIGKVDSIPKDGWILEVWRGEWAEYYISWKDDYIGSRWTWSVGITQFLVFVLMGAFPIGTFALGRKIKGRVAARLLTRQTTTLEVS